MKRVFSFAVVALLIFCGVVWAQEEPMGISPGIFSLIGGVDAIVAFVLPLIIAFITQRSWPEKVKKNVAWIACLVVSIGIAAAQGLLAGMDWTSAAAVGTKFGVILTITKTTYDGFWKPSAIAPKLELATDLIPASQASSETNTQKLQPVTVEPLPPFTEAGPSDPFKERVIDGLTDKAKAEVAEVVGEKVEDVLRRLVKS